MRTVKAQTALTFLSLLTESDKIVFEQVIDFLEELGYCPQKQRVQSYVIAFKHSQTKKVIAKAGIHNGKNQRAFLSIKFFCT